MLLIDYIPANFSDKGKLAPARPKTLRCTWADLVWAASTAADKQFYPTIQPQASAYWGLIHRITRLYTHLQTADYRPGLWGAIDTHLVQSPNYQRLGAAEKSTASTFMAHITAKLFAVELLRVPWLFNLDAYSQTSGVVGLDQEFCWVAIRVKGRSNRLEQRLVRKTQRLVGPVAIAGKPPKQQAAFFSYFTAVSKTLKVYWVDLPPAVHHRNLNLDITSDTFLRAYYALLVDLLSADYGAKTETVTIAGRAYRVKNIPEVDGQIGLEEKIYHLLQPGGKISPKDFTFDLAKGTDPKKEETKITVGQDGVFIRLGNAWRDDRMYLPPPERTL
jgi:hypothetical protein